MVGFVCLACIVQSSHPISPGAFTREPDKESLAMLLFSIGSRLQPAWSNVNSLVSQPDMLQNSAPIAKIKTKAKPKRVVEPQMMVADENSLGPAMLRRSMLAKVAIVAIAGLQAQAVAATDGDAAKGGKIFEGNCAACHVGGMNAIQPEKTLEKDALIQYLDGGLEPASIVKQVTGGKNAMPAFAERLSDEDIKNVAEYVYDQATNDKW